MSDLTLTRLPLHESARLIREHEISPLELTESTIAAIERAEPSLNAFVTVTAEEAITRARALTDAADEPGPLYGIPISLKDNIDTAGVKTTSGSPLFAGRVPASDSGAWRRLASAGAVLVGKNNLWELAFGGPHPAYGTTWNPWATDRTCGGTSSGSAAAVAAGLSCASLGTDTGGSARVPASLCGLVALKPTFGLVPRDGVLPVSYSMDHVCPIAREVRDVALVFSALAGSPPANLERDLVGTTIGVARPESIGPIADDVQATLDEALSVLAEQGATLRRVDLPDLDLAGTTARIIMDSEAADLHRERLRAKREQFGSIALNRLEAAEFIPATYYVRAQRVRQVITDALDATLRDVDTIALPAVGITAFPVGDDGFGLKNSHESPLKLLGRFTPLVNATGHPAVVFPCGLGADGLPTSLQLIGRFTDDNGLLAVARAYERATRWHSLVPALLRLAV